MGRRRETDGRVPPLRRLAHGSEELVRLAEECTGADTCPERPGAIELQCGLGLTSLADELAGSTESQLGLQRLLPSGGKDVRRLDESKPLEVDRLGGDIAL